MNRSQRILCGLALACVAGCSLPEGKSGTSCLRSSQCNAGLVCVEQRCTTNLSAVAEGSTVPEFGADDDAGTLREDASSEPVQDASSSTMTDASGAGTDASGMLDSTIADEDGG